MRILYYIHGLHIGGAETLITNYLLHLKKLGNEVFLVVNTKEDTFLHQTLQNHNIPMLSLRRKHSMQLLNYAEIALRKLLGYKGRWRKIYRDVKPDVVHIHTACDAFELCDFDPNRVFYTFHSNVERSLSMGSKLNLRKLCVLAQKGMSFTALTQKMLVDIKKRIKTEKVVLVPNAVDIEGIRSSRYVKEDFLKENGLPANSFLVGHVGRFHPVKNHEKLFSVFHEVYKKNPAARLVLVGTGSAQETERIEQLKEQYDVSDVTLMLGLRSDASAVMSVFDTLVLTSLNESFSLVLVEAQAQGVRCVASNVVPDEVVCENCLTMDLKETDEAWAEAILSKERHYSTNTTDQLDLPIVVGKLQELYAGVVHCDKSQK